MDHPLDALDRASAAGQETFRPEFFRLTDAADRLRLGELLRHRTCMQVHDTLHGQLMELVRCLNPQRKFTAAELAEEARAHLGNGPAREYGVWVHYPWNDRLVHLLDEEEFALVRTDRNRNKITREEQALLATKRVGVIGLSVGQSVAVTMALERSFGEIRLADFDTLELSNLNRIRSGVHEMGIPKVINTAREIAEIDPFLKVTLFPLGLTRENMDPFFMEGGRLDLLIEECDSVDIKIMARQKARALGVPVVMDTSDRGLLDVERFDIEPERPLLHGTIEHLDLDAAMRAKTAEEKLPFVVPMIGLENLSARMKASMLEIENTVTSWPQLASAVVSGGGIGAHVVRRILLGEKVPSGRWWLDPDDVLDSTPPKPGPTGDREEAPLTRLKPETLDVTFDAMASPSSSSPHRLNLSLSEARMLAQAGGLAPSGGNCQPWRFLHKEGRLHVFLDKERALSALDPGWRYAHLSLGACVENAALAAFASGLAISITYHDDQDDALVATLELTGRTPVDPDHQDIPLAQAIGMRCTNRKDSTVELLEDDDVEVLMDGFMHGRNGDIMLLRERATINAIAQLCGRAERIRFLNPTCHHDMFVKEMRWTIEEVERSADGIDIETLELPLADRVGLRVASDPRAMSLLRHWGAGAAIEKLTAKSVRASAALAILTVRNLGTGNAFNAGRRLQRFWLKANSMGLLAHPVGAPIFMGLHGRWDQDGILSAKEHHEAGAILDAFKNTAGITREEPFFMLRLGKAGAPTRRSLRRPLEHMFQSDTTPINV